MRGKTTVWLLDEPLASMPSDHNFATMHTRAAIVSLNDHSATAMLAVHLSERILNARNLTPLPRTQDTENSLFSPTTLLERLCQGSIPAFTLVTALLDAHLIICLSSHSHNGTLKELVTVFSCCVGLSAFHRLPGGCTQKPWQLTHHPAVHRPTSRVFARR